MKYSVVLPPTSTSHEVAVRAERLGFDRMWFFDSPILYTDVFVAMALAADRTERIELGTGVVVPSNRIPPVIANGTASLNALAPGRIILGMGTGFTGRNTMGQKAIRLADFEHHLEVIRALLDGENVLWRDAEAERRVALLQEEEKFHALEPRVPIWVSGMGPRAMELTARKADGWIAYAPGAEYGVRYLHGINAACEAIGRDPATLTRAIMTSGCVLDEDEAADSERGMAMAGPLAAVFYHNIVEGGLDFELPDELARTAEGYRKMYEAYEPADAKYLALHRGHLVRVRDDERPFISDGLIRGTSFTGSADELRAQLGLLEAAGCDEFGIQLVPGHEHEIERWAEVFGLTNKALA